MRQTIRAYETIVNPLCIRLRRALPANRRALPKLLEERGGRCPELRLVHWRRAAKQLSACGVPTPCRSAYRLPLAFASRPAMKTSIQASKLRSSGLFAPLDHRRMKALFFNASRCRPRAG